MVVNKIKIEIAYANSEKQYLMSIDVASGTTIHQAILSSCIIQQFPEIEQTMLTVGVFGKKRALDDVVKAGDRIEIYRPLTIDPKEARRLRHQKIKK